VEFYFHQFDFSSVYHWMIIVDTNGNADITRWNLGEHKQPEQEGIHTQEKLPMKWFVT